MYKVYGPYTRPDGRQHVIHYDGKTRRTQSYPRYLMENYLGRTLFEWEQVDHVDDDVTNNDISNLQLLTQTANLKKSRRYAEFADYLCPTCNNWFEMPVRQYRNNQLKQGKRGPYCSKSCAGRAGVR